MGWDAFRAGIGAGLWAALAGISAIARAQGDPNSFGFIPVTPIWATSADETVTAWYSAKRICDALNDPKKSQKEALKELGLEGSGLEQLDCKTLREPVEPKSDLVGSGQSRTTGLVKRTIQLLSDLNSYCGKQGKEHTTCLDISLAARPVGVKGSDRISAISADEEDRDLDGARRSGGEGSSRSPGAASAEARFVEGLSNFVLDRAKLEAIAYFEERFHSALCEADAANPRVSYFPSVCSVLANARNAGFSLATASREMRAAARRDLRALPDGVLHQRYVSTGESLYVLSRAWLGLAAGLRSGALSARDVFAAMASVNIQACDRQSGWQSRGAFEEELKKNQNAALRLFDALGLAGESEEAVTRLFKEKTAEMDAKYASTCRQRLGALAVTGGLIDVAFRTTKGKPLKDTGAPNDKENAAKAKESATKSEESMTKAELVDTLFLLFQVRSVFKTGGQGIEARKGGKEVQPKQNGQSAQTRKGEENAQVRKDGQNSQAKGPTSEFPDAADKYLKVLFTLQGAADRIAELKGRAEKIEEILGTARNAQEPQRKEQLRRLSRELAIFADQTIDLTDVSALAMELCEEKDCGLGGSVIRKAIAESTGTIRNYSRLARDVLEDRWTVVAVEISRLYLQQHPESGTKVLVGQYAPVIAELAGAQTSVEVQKILNDAAAPAGSYREKFRGNTRSLTAFAGASAGTEKYGTGMGGAGTAYGLFAPVGIHVTTPAAKGTHGALGVYVSVLDLGPYASYRRNESSVNAQPNIGLKQLFSPGVYGTWNISYGNKSSDWLYQSPFVLGAGWSRTPSLLQSSTTGETVDSTRWQLFFAVDVTLFPF